VRRNDVGDAGTCDQRILLNCHGSFVTHIIVETGRNAHTVDLLTALNLPIPFGRVFYTKHTLRTHMQCEYLELKLAS